MFGARRNCVFYLTDTVDATPEETHACLLTGKYMKTMPSYDAPSFAAHTAADRPPLQVARPCPYSSVDKRPAGAAGNDAGPGVIAARSPVPVKKIDFRAFFSNLRTIISDIKRCANSNNNNTAL